MFTFQAIQIFIFLIPGFVAAKILGAVVVRDSKQSDLEGVVEALIFSMLVYTIYSFTGAKSPIVMNTQSSNFSYSYEPISFLWLIGISAILPLLFGWVINSDVHMKFLRMLKITKRTSRHSVWYDSFYEKSSWIIIDFKDGRRVLGWARLFSDYPDKPFIYLADPKWINNENNYVETNLDGILFTPEQEISFIEFIRRNPSIVEKEGKNGKT